jgi:hypothetical protein
MKLSRAVILNAAKDFNAYRERQLSAVETPLI